MILKIVLSSSSLLLTIFKATMLFVSDLGKLLNLIYFTYTLCLALCWLVF
jgi:hypothetical protein